MAQHTRFKALPNRLAGHPSHGSTAAHARGSCALSAAQNHPRASVRLDQAGAGVQILQPARDHSGQCRVAPDVYSDELEAFASTGLGTRMSAQPLIPQHATPQSMLDARALPSNITLNAVAPRSSRPDS